MGFIIMLAGCSSMPRHAVRLDKVLREKIGKPIYDTKIYRCTMGAHRGASVQYTENTLDAIKAARYNKKYAFIEFDVQYTKDKRLIVFHDKSLLRLYGKREKISDTDYEELRRLTDNKIAAYDDIINAAGNKKKINIEIKSQGHTEENQRIVDFIVHDMTKRKRIKDLLISSISGDVVKYTNERYPEVATGQIFWMKSSTYLPLDFLTEGLYGKIRETKADYLMLHVANLHNIDSLLDLKPKDKTIIFWDFNDTMYLIHKDFSDRLWGNSGIKTYYNHIKYNIFSLFRRNKHGKAAD